MPYAPSLVSGLLSFRERSMRSHDLLTQPWTTAAFFWLPGLALVAASQLGWGWRTAVWTAALAVLAVACTANAVRCGRVHCYFTGPYFLILAALTLLYGLHAVSLGTHGWTVLSLAVAVGALVLCWLPERILGKYRSRRW
jgi:hypothetical protein